MLNDPKPVIEDGRPTLAVDFDYDAIEAPSLEAAAPAESATVRDVRTLQDFLSVILDSRPRHDSALSLLAAMAIALEVPGWDSQVEAARKLGISDSAISRATDKLERLLKRKERN